MLTRGDSLQKASEEWYFSSTISVWQGGALLTWKPLLQKTHIQWFLQRGWKTTSAQCQRRGAGLGVMFCAPGQQLAQGITAAQMELAFPSITFSVSVTHTHKKILLLQSE